MDFSRNMWSYILATLLFCSLFYQIQQFHFGENNNREELPLIYEEITDITLYPVDHFVSYHTSNYTQITPFLTFFKILFYGSELSNLKPAFLVFHLTTLILLFSILHLFLRRLYALNAIYSAFYILLIALIAETFIPAGRWLFINFFDPEWVTITILFGFIYTHIAKRYVLAALLMSLAGLMYPIYVIPLFPPLILLIFKNEFQTSKAFAFKLTLSYALIPAIYSIYLYFLSKQSAGQPFDASYIMEYIRAPWHYKIPSIYYLNKKAVGFLLLMLPFMLLGRRLIHGEYWERSLYLLVAGIFATLLLTSVIHSIIRIPLVVQISPYRIGLSATGLAFLLIPSLLKPWINSIKIPEIPYNRYAYMFALLSITSYLGFLIMQELSDKEQSPEVLETVEWIKENTTRNDLFLNYSGIDIRTQTLRSSYFEFKTIPLTANGQMEWYERFLKYNNQASIISPEELQGQFITGRPIEQFGVHNENKFMVLNKIHQPIVYLLTTSNDSLTINHQKAVFNNNTYSIFKVEPN